MDNLPAELQQRLAELQQLFHQQLPGEIEEIRHAWQQLAQQWNTAQLTQLHRLCHSLAGSSATFGAHEVGLAARALEQRLKALLAADEPPSQQQRVELEGMLEGLAHCTEAWQP